MRKKMRFACVIFLGSLVCGLNAAQAALTTYSYFYIAGQTAYTGVSSGSTISVPLFLQEVNSDGSTNSLLASEDGLFAAGVSAAFSSSSGSSPTTIAGIGPNSGSPTTGFDDILDQSSTSSSAAVLEQINFSDSNGVIGGAQTNGVSNVFLGTLMLQASSTPGQTTTFTVGAFDPSNGNTVTFDNGYDLDNNADPLNPAGASTLYSSAAPTNFSVTTSSVPEPATIAIVASGSMLILRRRRQVTSRVRRALRDDRFVTVTTHSEG
jgi:hypothetical protein